MSEEKIEPKVLGANLPGIEVEEFEDANVELGGNQVHDHDRVLAQGTISGDELDLMMQAFMDTLKSSIISGIQIAFDQFQATRNRSLGIEPKPVGVTGAGVSMGVAAGVSTGITAGIATDGDLGLSGRDLNMGSNLSFGYDRVTRVSNLVDARNRAAEEGVVNSANIPHGRIRPGSVDLFRVNQSVDNVQIVKD